MKEATKRKNTFHKNAEKRSLTSWEGARKILKLLSRTKENEELRVFASNDALIVLAKYKKNF